MRITQITNSRGADFADYGLTGRGLRGSRTVDGARITQITASHETRTTRITGSRDAGYADRWTRHETEELVMVAHTLGETNGRAR